MTECLNLVTFFALRMRFEASSCAGYNGIVQAIISFVQNESQHSQQQQSPSSQPMPQPRYLTRLQSSHRLAQNGTNDPNTNIMNYSPSQVDKYTSSVSMASINWLNSGKIYTQVRSIIKSLN